MTKNNMAPIIIIGAARSGTKFLRSVLDSAPNHSAVPYDVNYIWRYGAENAPDDQLNPDHLSDKQIAFIQKSLVKLAKLSGDDVLIEKTVSNTLRVPYVERVFPQARYVHLIRDGRDVTESAMRLWNAPPEVRSLIRKLREMPLSNFGYLIWFGKNFLTGLLRKRSGGSVWGPRFSNIETLTNELSLAEICAMQWRESVNQATQDLSKIDPSRVFTVRYEDLIKSDDAIMVLLESLGIQEKKSVIEFWKTELHVSKTRKWDAMLDADKSQAMAIMSETLSNNGYEL